MTIWNFGSINADHFYDVPHLPAPGETLAATAYRIGLGGKGANQSVAAARAGAEVRHIGAVGQDDAWAIDRLAQYGVKTDHIARVNVATGHAVIYVAASDGENSIVIYPGANAAIELGAVKDALEAAATGDLLLMQNETGGQRAVAEVAKARGLRLIYSAAPFDADAVRDVLPYIDTLIVNEVEARQLSTALDTDINALPVANVVVTLGSDGAVWHDIGAGTEARVAAIRVTPVDTTGAGDTFAGYLAAGLDAGLTVKDAMGRAAAAAALKVTRPGTADAIPSSDDVERFLATQS
ncbi:MAG: ribokinase [Alphaproteobacteria bacterium]|nr:ribokinase [Alphaproteobacteria bacterium]